MVSSTQTSPTSIVVDATVLIAICTKEASTFSNAELKFREYATNGCKFYAPGGMVMECLFVFCRKLKDGVLTPTEHLAAITTFIALMAAIEPPPSGDRSLIKRAEEIRGSLGCSRSADGLYLALAEELGKTAATEVVTFDNGMKTQAAVSAMPYSVLVLPTI